MTISAEELEQILSAGTIDERIAELLREQQAAEEASDATRDYEPTINAGRGQIVANWADPLKGMFERGRQDKKAATAKAEREKQAAKRDSIAQTMAEGALGLNLSPVDVRTAKIGTAPAVDTAAQDAVLAGPPPAAKPPVMAGGPPSTSPAPAPAATRQVTAPEFPSENIVPEGMDLPPGGEGPEMPSMEDLVEFLRTGKKKGSRGASGSF